MVAVERAKTTRNEARKSGNEINQVAPAGSVHRMKHGARIVSHRSLFYRRWRALMRCRSSRLLSHPPKPRIPRPYSEAGAK